MCDWGTETTLEVTVPSHLSCTGEARRKVVGVDPCIAPIVEALNAAGILTTGCCCGHGRGPDDIHLADGRVLMIYGPGEVP